MFRFCLSTNNYKNKGFPKSHCFLITAWKVVPIGIFQVFITRNWEVADLDSSLNNFFWFNSSKSWQVTSVLRCRMHCQIIFWSRIHKAEFCSFQAKSCNLILYFVRPYRTRTRQNRKAGDFVFCETITIVTRQNTKQKNYFFVFCILYSVLPYGRTL